MTIVKRQSKGGPVEMPRREEATMATKFRRIQPRRAYEAARAILKDPEDLAHVFTLIESLSGWTLERMHRRLGSSEAGRRLLAERPDIVERLADRAALAKLPDGSLGRAYLDFVEREGISAEGIRAASAAGMEHDADLPAGLDFVHTRLRDTHDLWHAAVGYRGDLVGETALLAFTLAQSWNPGVALIVGIGLVKTRGLAEARRVILDGFRRGRKARWLPAEEWEALLALPVDEVRRQLGLEAPPAYSELRPADVKRFEAAAA